MAADHNIPGVDLLESGGKNSTVVFVDRLSKIVRYTPCTKEILVEKYLQIFINHVFKHHGLPEIIIINQDHKFRSLLRRVVLEDRNGSLV